MSLRLPSLLPRLNLSWMWPLCSSGRNIANRQQMSLLTRSYWNSLIWELKPQKLLRPSLLRRFIPQKTILALLPSGASPLHLMLLLPTRLQATAFSVSQTNTHYIFAWNLKHCRMIRWSLFSSPMTFAWTVCDQVILWRIAYRSIVVRNAKNHTIRCCI